MNYLALDYSRDLGIKTAQIGGWTATAWQTEERDYKFYSKAWHRNHGPKITVTGRYVKFTSAKGREKTAQLDSWRGNWQAKALILAGLVKPKKGQMHIRLNEAFDIKIIKKSRGYNLYQRTLKGEAVDFCLVSPLGLTYHGASMRECLAGLKQKRESQSRRESATIDWKFLRSLGFCEAGIREFCSVFGFDIKKSYAPMDIYVAVSQDLPAAAPFERELRQLADVVGFKLFHI
jgi:hypothetical protein